MIHYQNKIASYYLVMVDWMDLRGREVPLHISVGNITAISCCDDNDPDSGKFPSKLSLSTVTNWFLGVSPTVAKYGSAPHILIESPPSHQDTGLLASSKTEDKRFRFRAFHSTYDDVRLDPEPLYHTTLKDGAVIHPNQMKCSEELILPASVPLDPHHPHMKIIEAAISYFTDFLFSAETRKSLTFHDPEIQESYKPHRRTPSYGIKYGVDYSLQKESFASRLLGASYDGDGTPPF